MTLQPAGRGRGCGGGGSEYGRTGRDRGGVESQACRVAAKPTVMLATGIGCCGPQVVFGVYIKRTGCEHENTTHFSRSIPSFASPTLLFSLALRLSFCLPSHERHIQGAAESLSSGGETVCLQGCHDKVQERPGRGEERIEVEKRGGQQSEKHKPNYYVIRDDRGNVSTIFLTELMTQVNKLLAASQEKYHLLPVSPHFNYVCLVFCTAVSTVSIKLMSIVD